MDYLNAGSDARTRTSSLQLRTMKSAVSVSIISGFLLSWVAVLNHAPLVFADTIAYATAAFRNEVPGLFSFYYSLLILPFHNGVTFWPVVIVQGALLGHLIYLVARI